MAINYDKLLNLDIEYKNQVDSELSEIIEENEILYSISKIFIEYRKEKKMTQKNFAELIGTNQTMVSKIESGKYNPTFKEIYKISRKLTNSVELFNEILEEILLNLKEVEKITQITIASKANDSYNVKNFYINAKNKSNILYIQDYYTKNKGEIDYGKSKSRYTIVG